MLGAWTRLPLYLRILIGLVLGVVVGVLAGPSARSLDVPARLVLRVLGALAPAVVLLAVIHALFASNRADRAFLDAHATGVDDLRQAAAAWTLDRAAEVSGVSREDLATFVEWYASISPALIRCGWGQERNRNGGAATMAILALPAVAGKFGVRGGGYTMSNSAAWGIAADRIIGVPAPPKSNGLSELPILATMNSMSPRPGI